MKKILFLAAICVALLTSCSPKLTYMSSIGYIDYQTFANNGMYLTESNSVNFDYTPMGSVSVTVYSGKVESVRAARYQYTDFNGYREDTEKYDQWKLANPTDAISLAVDAAKAQGGNGIINLKVVPTTGYDDNHVMRSGLLVTGMVIRK